MPFTALTYRPTDPQLALTLLVVIASAFLIVLISLAACVKIVPEYCRLVAFRLGRYIGVYGPGLCLRLPLLDLTILVDLREQVQPVEGLRAVSQDGQAVAVDGLWGYRVIDPAASVLKVNNLKTAMRDLPEAALRALLGKIPFSDLLFDREWVRLALEQRLREMSQTWGVEITKVEVREIRKAS